MEGGEASRAHAFIRPTSEARRLSFDNHKWALRPNQPGESEPAVGQQRSELTFGTLPTAEAVEHVEILEVGGKILTRVVGKHALDEQ